MKEKKISAYMTVEASLVFPMIFGSLLFVIFLALYLYNAVVLKQISTISALRGSRYMATEKEIENYVEEQVDQLIEERLIFVSKYQKNIQVKETKIEVDIVAKVNLPFLQIPFLNREWQELEYSSQAKRINPVKIIRNARKLYGS